MSAPHPLRRHRACRTLLRAPVLGAALGAGVAAAETSAFVITDDPALDAVITSVRHSFLAARTYITRLDATVLLPSEDGSWRRGSYNPNAIAYPASCVKLAYLASAMYWCRTNGKPYDFLDADVGPMIRVSDNVATGRVVDAITDAPNDPSISGTGSPGWEAWYAKRLYTENHLSARGLLENQTILNKTYPTNSGSSPSGAEQVCISYRGGNRMQPRLSASLMLEIQKGAIEPGGTRYMQGLLTHDRWGADSVFGFGLPPGCMYQNKPGRAYDTLEDIAYIQLPNGEELVLAAFSNAYQGPEPSNPAPYDGSVLGVFAEMLIEALALGAGNPPKVKIDNAAASFSATGTWSTGPPAPDKYGDDYLYATIGGDVDTATWGLSVPQTGRYEVAVWYPRGRNRVNNVPFTVHHVDGSTTVRINQQVNGGRWVRLGDFDFEAGTGSVVLSDEGITSAGMLLADAVKITMWPVATIADNLVFH